MLYLRLFLIYPDAGGDLTVQISSEYEEFKRLWDDLSADQERSALVHVGFSRMDNDVISSLFRKYPSKLLFSGAANDVLSSLLKVKTSYVEKIGDVSIFKVVNGDQPEVNLIASANLPLTETSYPDWVVRGNSFNWFRNYQASNPGPASLAIQAGITDDLNYQVIEATLPIEVRVDLATERALFILDMYKFTTIKEVPRILPPWLLTQTVEVLNLSLRSRNRLELHGITHLFDLTRFTDEQLLKHRGMGRTLLNEIRLSLDEYACSFVNSKTAMLASLKSEIGNSPVSNDDLSHSQISIDLPEGEKQDTLLGLFGNMLQRLTSSQRRVVEYRSGLNGTAKTLQEVGEIIGSTRERVRQIQKGASAALMGGGHIGRLLDSHLDEVREGMAVPLRVDNLHEYDPWFEGCQNNRDAFEFLVDLCANADLFQSTGYSISKYKNDLGIIVNSDRDILSEYIKDFTDFIKQNLNNGTTKDQIREKIFNVVSIDSPELVDFVFHEATQGAKFSVDSAGKEILIHYGNNIESEIIDILVNSSTPMNIEDIASGIRAKYNPSVEVGYVRNACINHALLFGRSTYGLVKHLPFSSEEIEDISERVKDLMGTLSDTRQWHCNEIIEQMPELRQEYGERINQYNLALILDLSKKLVNHTKLQFSLSGAGDDGSGKRIKFLSLVEDILSASETPLTSAEIYALASKERGLGSSVQIHQTGKIVSFGRGVWGLLDKHLGLTEVDFEIIIEDLLKLFDGETRGLNNEELISRLPMFSKAWQLRNNPGILFSLATKSKKFKVSDIFVYPADWAEPFRVTQRLALEQSFKDIPTEGRSLADILDNASLIYGHPIAREAAYGVVREMGAFHDEATGRWFKK